jgi:hypothetical protein
LAQHPRANNVLAIKRQASNNQQNQHHQGGNKLNNIVVGEIQGSLLSQEIEDKSMAV